MPSRDGDVSGAACQIIFICC